MEKAIEIALSDVDVRYGIIKIRRYFDDFFEGKPGNITLRCNRNVYNKRIPSHGGYISGLTKIHRENRAQEGMIVSITKENESFSLQYFQEADKNIARDSLENTIEEIRYLMKEQTWAFFKNETNVRNEIIDPILRQLGWKFPDSLFREPITRDSKKVDYALRHNGRFQILIESKSFDHFESKDWGKACAQLKNYLNDDRFKGCIGILTNGVKWEVFDTQNPIALLTIFDKGFIDFANCFKSDEFNGIDDLVTKLKGLKFPTENSSEIINAHTIILNKEENEVEGKYEVDKYINFIKENVEQVDHLDRDGCFGKEVVKKQDTDIKKARGFEKYQEHYIAKDYSTLEKAVIIQQIIREIEKLGDNASSAYSIKIIND